MKKEQSKQDNLADLLSSKRPFIMGCAMIGVLLFHAQNEYLSVMSSAFFRIFGRWGVEIFLFVSGFGVYYSLNKNPEPFLFYKKRLIRIYPAALIAGWITYLFNTDNITAILGVNLWYIRTIFVFYLFSPILMCIVRKKHALPYIVAICLICVTGAIVCKEFLRPHIHYFFAVTIDWSLERFPSYILGMYVAAIGFKKTESNISVYGWGIIGLICLIIAVLLRLGYDLNFYSNLHLLVLIYLFLGFAMPLLCVLLAQMGTLLPTMIQNSAAWLGKLSLEIYVIHELLYIQIGQLLISFPRIAQTLAIITSLAAAWGIHNLLAISSHQLKSIRHR